MKNFDIEKVKKRTLVKYPFFGSIIASTELISSTKVQTAGTDGNKIIYNPEYLSSLSKDEQTFVFAHEICHIAFNHVGRRKNKDRKVWNMATDAVVNAFLQSDGLRLAPGGVDIPEALNHDAEEMYEIFLKQKNNQEKGDNQSSMQDQKPNSTKEDQNDSSSKDGSEKADEESSTSNPDEKSQTSMGSKEESEGLGSSTGSGCDDHDFWDDDVNIDDYRDSNEEIQNNDLKDNKDEKESLFDKIRKKIKKEKKTEESIPDRTAEEEQQEERQKAIEKISEMGEKEAFAENQKQKQDRLKQMMDSLSKEVSSAGKTGGNQSVQLDDIGNARNLIDWRPLLKEAVNHEVDWSYRDSEIEDGVLKPYLEEIPIPETEIVLDTSGSIDEELLRCFLRECKNILKDSRIKAGCFDTKFYGFHEIRTEEDIDNMPFVGRGGTNFNAAVNAFSKRVENKIIFTDGAASMPDKTIDAIWVVFGNKKINPPGGRVIYVNEQMLRNAYSVKTR